MKFLIKNTFKNTSYYINKHTLTKSINYDRCCFLNYFLSKKIIKMIFFILKKIFLILNKKQKKSKEKNSDLRKLILSKTSGEE